MAIGPLAIRIRYDTVSVACDYTVCLHFRARNVHLAALEGSSSMVLMLNWAGPRESCKC